MKGFLIFGIAVLVSCINQIMSCREAVLDVQSDANGPDGPISSIDISDDADEAEDADPTLIERDCKLCAQIFSPVCGLLKISHQQIYRTFSNACMLENANCNNPETQYKQATPKIASCEEQKLISICSAACPRNYKPVCGERRNSKGVTVWKKFSNDCLFWNANCLEPNNQWTKVSGYRCW